MPTDVLRPLPSGMVTFLFTDIEGSTKILKRVPDKAAGIFDRHNEIIRNAIRGCGGHEIGTEGDSFFVAFDDADQAFDACASAQTALVAEPWPEDGVVRVRMGVHSGLAAPRGDNYLALAVHQAARVSAAAHGGQVIISGTALEGAKRQPPGETVALGRYRVRDFDEPELLYRLDPPDVPVTDRPIRATPAGGHNLITPQTSFVGRSLDVDLVSASLATNRILNLVGLGGTGKTRLATEVGLRAAADWTDGVWIVELADLADSSLVPMAIADALGLAPTGGLDPWPDVLAWARDKNSLLIIDNIETHLDVCARLLPELIRHPGIGVMTTSREPLQVGSEVVYRVKSLDLPASSDDPASVRGSPSVELFVDRARTRQPNFELDDQSARDIALLCRRLDGLPLAIEIAAARVSVMSVNEILDGLHDRFDLLRSTDRDLPERHRTMHNLLSWSYDLLEPAEQIAFRRLAVFGGSFTVDAAVAALADSDLASDDVAELVWALVDKSLVVADLTEHSTRYRLLETVGDFAERLMVDHGDESSTVRRSAAALLERVGPWSTADRAWIGEVSVELANIRSLVDRLGNNEQELAQALVCSLARYHDAVQSFSTGIEELGRAVERFDAPTPTRVAMLTSLADLRLRRAETTEAQALLDTAFQLAGEVGAPTWNDAAVDRTRGELLFRSGASGEAVDVARAALARGLSPLGEARMWNLDGIAHYFDGDYSSAFKAFEHELELYEHLGFEVNVASAHGNLAEAALHLDDVRSAAEHQQACLDLALVIGQPVMLAYSSLVAARMAVDLENWELALRLQASAQSHLATAGHALYPDDQALLDELRTAVNERIGSEAASAAELVGARLQAIEAASLAAEVFAIVRSTD